MANGSINIGDEVAIELIGNVTHIDGDLATVNFGVTITVNLDSLRLVNAYKPPPRKKPLVDKPT
ncbi:MAG: hypothetical protein E5Y02_33850 [Mesorhizobium sp.]|uniref:hypothetical protein n=1 Tax=Mesorhizobium TaxID=68287 RepID=UPI0003CE735E|nr:hypothetical protein [Mesorhizobium sp. LNHC221B00]TIN90280.1 MAG: hypothetical protein E5Y06_33445 [Mesorhizobium sp.]ESY72530.1 hypothetical protein X740_33060 [Mesorhizobium sp. LNHC221B00]TJU93826.1 MAG: hypothetical protein E5Y08_32585 [Mesorhizobium sp.]TJV13374.1 MAG: hypothetical protein E5Y07_31805 [Mesorhizobium sp.]TJV37040.1 MAG: hypothetical protein E5Y02_33850 [Mesorhizobium sp.]